MTHWNDPDADPLADIQKVAEWMLNQTGFSPKLDFFTAILESERYNGSFISLRVKSYPVNGPCLATLRAVNGILDWNEGIVVGKIKLRGYSFECELKLLTVTSATEYEIELAVKGYEKIFQGVAR